MMGKNVLGLNEEECGGERGWEGRKTAPWEGWFLLDGADGCSEGIRYPMVAIQPTLSLLLHAETPGLDERAVP